MNIIADNENYKLYNGSMLDLDKIIPENSIDAIVTDPPYELNFMNKGWDNSGIAFQKETWEKCFKVLKPGGHMMVFGGSRTHHRIACAIEDAGFEIRDTIMWLYGCSMPKSMNLGKAIEAKEKLGNSGTRAKREIELSCEGEEYTVSQPNNGIMGERKEFTRKDYIPGTDNAKKWQNWGTQLKPSYEAIIVARKPCEGTITENVLKYGVGGINIDECRIGNEEISTHNAPKGTFAGGDYNRGSDTSSYRTHEGRFPANTILTYDENDFDEVCGGMPITKSNGGEITYPDFKDVARKQGTSKLNFGAVSNAKRLGTFGYCFDDSRDSKPMAHGYEDEGSAARYFYSAKASKRDRDEGLDLFEGKKTLSIREDGEIESEEMLDDVAKRFTSVRKNTHPSVKPCSLMQYVVRLVSPKGATILDPFMGSGSTGKAVMYENKDRDANYKFIGIDLEEEYCRIAHARIEYARTNTLLANDGTTPVKKAEEIKPSKKAPKYKMFDLGI